METIDARAFETLRQSKLREYGWIMPDDAQGFVSDLGDAFEDAGFASIGVAWLGNGMFSAGGDIPPGIGRFGALLQALVRASYGPDRCAATGANEDGRVVISFATWTPEIGVATVRVEANLK